MEQSGLLVSENVFEPVLALAEGDYGLLELTAPKEGTSAQPCQVGSLKLRIQGPSLPLTKKNGKMEVQMDHCSHYTIVY